MIVLTGAVQVIATDNSSAPDNSMHIKVSNASEQQGKALDKLHFDNIVLSDASNDINVPGKNIEFDDSTKRSFILRNNSNFFSNNSKNIGRKYDFKLNIPRKGNEKPSMSKLDLQQSNIISNLSMNKEFNIETTFRTLLKTQSQTEKTVQKNSRTDNNNKIIGYKNNVTRI